MKTFFSVLLGYLSQRRQQRNLFILLRFLLILALMIASFSTVFHFLMALEGQAHSWITGVYWTLVVMSTLGFGDITFESDIGRIFSVVVLLSGTLFLLVLLPFTFIQFFYAPWMEAQTAARAPDHLPADTRGHVILTNYGPVDAAFVRLLQKYRYPYAVIEPQLSAALDLHDQGVRVVLGAVDDPETYRKVRVDQAVLVAATLTDPVNTNIAFTVREISPTVPVVATASAEASIDILELAGTSRVLMLASVLGQALARRVIGRDARAHVIGEFDDMMVAEAAAANTPLVGRTLREARLREQFHLSVAGVWERGMFALAGPDTRISEHTVLVMTGTVTQLDAYNQVFQTYKATPGAVIIIGGGRVGRAAARALDEAGFPSIIVEKRPERVRDPSRYVAGDAADLEVLKQAGIDTAPSVLVTTHEDDINVYLTLYCRRLRPDIQILSRSTLERNVSTLHRAGADFVLSYASMGANVLINLLRRGDILFMAEGLHVFRLPVPPSLEGSTIAASAIRGQTGCSIVALKSGGKQIVNPPPQSVLEHGAEIVLIGGSESEERFLSQYVSS
ncbi:MAG: NAD-binding protein [Bryobacterales bacterium]|nr:NAD-binding protein [Bryobacterales bacterium]